MLPRQLIIRVQHNLGFDLNFKSIHSQTTIAMTMALTPCENRMTSENINYFIFCFLLSITILRLYTFNWFYFFNIYLSCVYYLLRQPPLASLEVAMSVLNFTWKTIIFFFIFSYYSVITEFINSVTCFDWYILACENPNCYCVSVYLKLTPITV